MCCSLWNMEHFVSDWKGYRTFLLYTNHQPVRNYAYRKLGKLPPKPNDPWHPDVVRAEEENQEFPFVEGSEPDLDAYDPCVTQHPGPEPETLWEDALHGPAHDQPDLSSGSDTKDSNDSNWDKGRLVFEAPSPPTAEPPTKKQRTE